MNSAGRVYSAHWWRPKYPSFTSVAAGFLLSLVMTLRWWVKIRAIDSSSFIVTTVSLSHGLIVRATVLPALARSGQKANHAPGNGQQRVRQIDHPGLLISSRLSEWIKPYPFVQLGNVVLRCR